MNQAVLTRTRNPFALIALAAFALASVTACGPTPPPPDTTCEAGTGRVEVGQGGSRLRRLPATDAELDIVRGAQGGIHVVVGAWVEGIDLNLTMRYRLVETGELLGMETTVELRPALFSPDAERFVRHPDLLVLDNLSPDVERFAGRTVELEVEVESVDGSHACDARTVTLVDPDA